jgi:hypothetical protein
MRLASQCLPHPPALPVTPRESSAAPPALPATLHRYQILDKTREAAFNDITCPAAMICGTPMALISLVDHDRQWFKKKWVWG